MTHWASKSKRIPRASILAIGTELTTGQVTNRNAAWISERLSDLGIEVVLHETVPDDRAMIRESLERCAGLSAFVFVTGGLGPTSDDFTREVVADWAGEPLSFHEPSWEHIVSRLTRVGVPVAESNRQQCYYPQSAQDFEVLANREGTANAFQLAHEDSLLFVLPGPPREIETVWRDHRIEERIRARVPGLKCLILHTWQCMGKSEAELGEITEKALEGSGLAIGYRAHMPFVEIKVWVPEGAEAHAKPYFIKLEEALRPWVMTRQGVDLGGELLRSLSRGEEISILDSASGGILAERLGAFLRKNEFTEVAKSLILATEWARDDSPEEHVQNTLTEADPGVITLVISGFTPEGQWALGLRDGNTMKIEVLRSPWKAPEFLERTRRMAVELAFKRWREWMDQSVQ